MIWPFKKKEKEERKMPKYKGIRFGNLSYVPEKDITAYEVSLLLPLFMSMFYFDRKEYIERNNLTRHFKEINNEPVN